MEHSNSAFIFPNLSRIRNCLCRHPWPYQIPATHWIRIYSICIIIKFNRIYMIEVVGRLFIRIECILLVQYFLIVDMELWR